MSDVTRLLRSGVSSHIRDRGGWTPLHLAAAWNQVSLIEPLVGAGAELDARTPSDGPFNSFPSSTPLCGADTDARNADGATPLRLAVETSGTYHLVSPLLAKFFIDAGADINAYDNGGYTIFYKASQAINLAPGHLESQEVIEMLQERKARM